MVTRRKQQFGRSRRAVQAREQARPREVKTKPEPQPKPIVSPSPEPPEDLVYKPVELGDTE